MKHPASLYVLMAMVISVPVFAQSPDFQGIMNGLQAKLAAATEGAWNDTLWPFAAPNPPESGVWVQQDPAFPAFDHTGNGIKDDDHLAFFQRVLDDDPLVVEVLAVCRTLNYAGILFKY